MNKKLKNLNYARRSIGIVVCASPLALSITCIVLHQATYPLRHTIGITLALLACLLALLNFNLSFIRPWIYCRKHKTKEGYKHVSGLPMLGTMLQIIGCMVAFGNPTAGILSLTAGILDTGGLPWFAISTWKDKSFWDK